MPNFTLGTMMNHVRMCRNNAQITRIEALASKAADIISSNFQAIKEKPLHFFD